MWDVQHGTGRCTPFIYEFNFLQAANYLWASFDVFRDRLQSYTWTNFCLDGLAVFQLELTLPPSTAAGTGSSCCTKWCLIVSEWIQTWRRPQNFRHDCSTKPRKFGRVYEGHGQDQDQDQEDVATAQQHWHIHHFSGARTSRKDQGFQPPGDSSCCSNIAATSCHMSRRCRDGTRPKDQRTMVRKDDGTSQRMRIRPTLPCALQIFNQKLLKVCRHFYRLFNNDFSVIEYILSTTLKLKNWLIKLNHVYYYTFVNEKGIRLV